AGVPHTIIPDNAGAWLMSLGMIDLVIVGADRIAANGDTANKIGTLDGVPAHIDLDGLGRRLAGVPGVREVHDLHVWPIGAERLALSAHVRLENLDAWPQILDELSEIAEHQGIEHVTFQPESIRSIQAKPVNFIKR
ncbi:MAG: hypothetical protein WBP66_03740, partial [Azonexus sp.]